MVLSRKEERLENFRNNATILSCAKQGSDPDSKDVGLLPKVSTATLFDADVQSARLLTVVKFMTWKESLSQEAQ
jgi:hypothetical protein